MAKTRQLIFTTYMMKIGTKRRVTVGKQSENQRDYDAMKAEFWKRIPGLPPGYFYII